MHSDVQCIIFNLCVLTADEEDNNSEMIELSKKLSKTVQDYNLIKFLDMNTASLKKSHNFLPESVQTVSVLTTVKTDTLSLQ